MKVYQTEEPTKEVRVFKPDTERLEYDIYVLVPQRIGGMRKVGTAQYRTEDGAQCTNIEECVEIYLERAGFKDLLATTQATNRAPKRVVVNGFDMARDGKWAEFCKALKLDPNDRAQMDKNHILSPKQAAALGIKA